MELPSDIAAFMSAAEDGAAGPGAVDDAAVAPLVDVEAVPGSPGGRTSATASDWAMCDANKDDSFSDSVRSSLENMCRRAGGPVHYLRTRFPTVESKTEFAAWLYATFPPLEVLHYACVDTRRGLSRGRPCNAEFTRMTS